MHGNYHLLVQSGQYQMMSVANVSSLVLSIYALL